MSGERAEVMSYEVSCCIPDAISINFQTFIYKAMSFQEQMSVESAALSPPLQNTGDHTPGEMSAPWIFLNKKHGIL